jgi:hypothetical protein
VLHYSHVSIRLTLFPILVECLSLSLTSNSAFQSFYYFLCSFSLFSFVLFAILALTYFFFILFPVVLNYSLPTVFRGLSATATAQVPSQVRSRGICGGQNGTVAGFLRVLRSSLLILIPPTAPYSSVVPSSTLYSLATDSVVK